MQIQFNTGVCTLLLVKVPEDFKEIAGANNNELFYWTETCTQRMGDYPHSIHIENVLKYEIVGLSHELTEEQCKSIVFKMPWGNDCYKNYELIDKPQFVGLNAKESFDSILRHLKVYNVNPYTDPEERFRCRDCADCDGTCCNEELIKFCDPDIHKSKWKEAQERTGTWAVLRLEE